MRNRKLKRVDRRVLEPTKYHGLIGTHLAVVLAIVVAGIMGMSSALTVDIAPDTLNVDSQGSMITAYLEGPIDEVLFADDFELAWEDQNAGSWVVKEEAGTSNHVFEAKSVGTRGTAIFAGDTSWSDYTLEARVKTTDTYWGVIVRADGAATHFYSTYLNVAEQVAETWEHYGTDLLNDRQYLEKYPTDIPAIVSGAWYDMRIEVAGAQIALSYKPASSATWDNAPQDIVLDSVNPYMSGRIGLIFYDDGYPSSKCAWFDNVKVTASDGTLLFSDDFERGWTEVSGSWQIERDLTAGGMGHPSDWAYSPVPAAGVEEITLVAGDVSWTDYTMEYKVKIYAADGGVAREGSALVRADDDGKNAYLVHPRVGGDSGIVLYKEVGGVWGNPVAVSNGGVLQNTWHMIRVAVAGNNIKVYLDGSEMPCLDYTDATSPYMSGRVGLRQGEAARHAHYDDVVVTAPSYDMTLIDVSSLRLCYGDVGNVITEALSEPTSLGDYDSDGIQDLMVKFDRAKVVQFLKDNGLVGIEVELIVAGGTTQGLDVSGTDSIKTIAKGKIKI